MNWFGFTVAIALISSCSIGQKASSPVLQNDIEKRIDILLNGMLTKEKVGQTCQVTLDVLLAKDTTGKNLEPMTFDKQKVREALVEYGVGSVLNVAWTTISVEEWKKVFDGVHKPFMKKQTKVPVIFGIDAIHGATYTKSSTLFPQEIGLAATWNRGLAREFAEVTAYETRASGIHWNFSPVLDLGRQPLWARHFETLGEDPFLASELGRELILGYQGEDRINQYQVAACMKHFVGYSNPTSGRDRTPAWIPDKYLKELYLPPFKAAVDAGALTVMINSGALNGVPGHINQKLITDVLKKDWGFEGFAVSDWEDFIMLHTVHRTSASLKDAIVKAINAGVDMSMVPMSPQYKEYCELLLEAVNEGLVSEERLDDAVRRILRVKFKVGLFDENFGQANDYPDFSSKKHADIALKSALESITLLENDGVLPLNKNQKVLLVGPTANNLIYLNGAWTHSWQGADDSFNNERSNILQEAQNVFGKDNVFFEQGAKLILKDGFETTESMINNDLKVKAQKADVILLCLGEFPSTEKPGDIRSLNLDEAQVELTHFVKNLGKPVVLVLTEGRPRIIREIVDDANAIVQAYLPGDFGAEALMKLLLGEANFSGRLPYTYPKYDGQIEFYDRPRSVDRGKDNQFTAFNPQWEFGHGLSYSEVEYSNLQLSDTLMNSSDSILVQIDIENKSDRTVEEVVQLYISDIYASTIPAGKRLKGFEKLALLPMEKKTVSFWITESMLRFVGTDGNWLSEEGKFSVMINNNRRMFNLKK